MKKTKKITAAVMALTMVSALAPMTAFADTVVDNKNNPAPKNASFDVSYTYTLPAPTYTVTIPAGVTLSDSESVAKEITAESVTNMEANGKKIVVTLDAATNDNDTDTTFHAKNGDSDATYTITAGTNAVKVGDTVAEFTADGSSALTFSKITLPASPVAGDYTETLTFGISVEDAVTTPTVGTVFPIGTADLGDYYYWNHELDADKLCTKFKNFGTATISVNNNYSHPSLGNYRVISITSPTAQGIDWEMTQMDPTGPWAEWSNMTSYNYFKVDNYDTTPTGIKIASGSGTEDDPFTFELVFD